MSAKRRCRIVRGSGLLTGAVVCLTMMAGVSTAWASSTGVDGAVAALTANALADIGEPPAQLAQNNPRNAQDRPPAPEPRTVHRQRRNVERSYELPDAKADALFELLKFDDVKVLVGRQPGGARIEGSAREAAAIDRLIDLITREQDRKVDDVEAFIEKMRPTWNSEETYRLPEAKAKALYALLAFDNVPVLVSMVPEGVHVEASKKDQRTISDVAKILRGEQPAERAAREPRARQRQQAERRRPRARSDEEERARAEHHEAMMDQLRQLHGEFDRQMNELNKHADQLHAEVERRAQELHAEAEQLHAEVERIRAEVNATAEHIEKELGAFQDEQHGMAAPPAAPEPRAQTERERNRPDRVVTRSYKLPPEHAAHLFALLAPNDIRDVIVSQEGDVIQVRATVRDQETIERLVEILTRGQGKE